MIQKVKGLVSRTGESGEMADSVLCGGKLEAFLFTN